MEINLTPQDELLKIVKFVAKIKLLPRSRKIWGGDKEKQTTVVIFHKR